MPVEGDLNSLVTKLKLAQRRKRVDEALLSEAGDVLWPILIKPRGDLKRELGQMWKYLRKCRHPDRVVFSVRPHDRQPTRARIWWLQVLLMLAQGYPPRRPLLVPKGVVPRFTSLDEAQSAAKRAWKRYLNEKGLTAALDQVLQCLDFLSNALPPICKVDGNRLIYKGRRIGQTLSKQEVGFLDLLIQAAGRPVTAVKFAAKGIRYPKTIKSRLIKKPRLAFLRKRIRSGHAGSYCLDLD